MRHRITVSAVALAIASSTACASTLDLPGPNYNGNLTWNNDGTVEYNGVAYNAVLQQDKLYKDFQPNSGLPSGSTIQFSFSHINVDDYHTVAFGDSNFGNIQGAIYSWSYAITITDQTLYAFSNVASDVLQTAGVVTLATTLTAQDSDTYSTSFTKTNSNGYVGTVNVALDVNDVTLEVVNTLTIGANGSNATGVSNSFTQTPIPEPSTWAMMAVGFAGLALAGYRRRRPVNATA